MKDRYIILGLVALGIIGIGMLVWNNVRQTQQYYLKMNEFARMKTKLDGKGIRINGIVKPGSIQANKETLEYRFIITDGTTEIPVEYKGMVSDIFGDGIEVVVEGVYQAQPGIIRATQVLTKCPSKYQAAPGEKTRASVN